MRMRKDQFGNSLDKSGRTHSLRNEIEDMLNIAGYSFRNVQIEFILNERR